LGCDDGNLKDGDGCSASCIVEPGYFCSGGTMDGPDYCQWISFDIQAIKVIPPQELTDKKSLQGFKVLIEFDKEVPVELDKLLIEEGTTLFLVS
jgi:hypothetical protein